MARRLRIGGLIHFDKTTIGKTLHVPCAVGNHIVDVRVRANLDPNGTVKEMLNHGWTIGRRRLVCPDCKRASVQAKADRRRAMEDQALIPAVVVPPVAPDPPDRSEGKAKGGRARWANTTPEERSAHGRKIAEARWGKRETETVAEATPAPSASDRARASKRAAMDWLSEAFDVEKGTFKAGVSDATIAKETGLAETAIAKLREEFFGPLGEPDELRALRDELATTKRDLDALAASVVAGKGIVAAIERRFGLLCTKMGWVAP